MTDTPKTDELQGYLLHSDTYTCWQQTLKLAERLERENSALRADKERMDWLGKTKCAYFHEGPCVWRINEDKTTDGDTIREAIDSARDQFRDATKKEVTP